MKTYFIKMLIDENYFPRNIPKKLFRENKFSLNAKFFDLWKLISAEIACFKVEHGQRLEVGPWVG